VGLVTPDALIPAQTSPEEISALFGRFDVAMADALDAARKYRNQDLYDVAGIVDGADVDALLARVLAFEGEVRGWLAQHHPELSST
jgi:hypothetical protein